MSKRFLRNAAYLFKHSFRINVSSQHMKSFIYVGVAIVTPYVIGE